jgi:hypothetical protein
LYRAADGGFDQTHDKAWATAFDSGRAYAYSAINKLQLPIPPQLDRINTFLEGYAQLMENEGLIPSIMNMYVMRSSFLCEGLEHGR